MGDLAADTGNSFGNSKRFRICTQVPTASCVISSWIFLYPGLFAYKASCGHKESILLASASDIWLEGDQAAPARHLLSVTKLVKFESLLKQDAEWGHAAQ